MGLSHSQKETVRMQFDCLCKKVLREYSRDIERQRKRRNEREIIFSGMSESEIANLYVKDEYPSDYTLFCVLGYQIEIQNESLADAIASLSEEMRDILLLSYFLEMNDIEIAELMNMIRRTVQRRRSSIEMIREQMEEDFYE